jgi:AcrR family transcriptional regulator
MTGSPPPAPTDYVLRVEQACAQLAADSTPITVDAVAARAGVGRATLYRRPELRALIDEHRRQARDALTITGLAIQIDQLRTALEAVASNVRRHEEQLRRLSKKHPGGN